MGMGKKEAVAAERQRCLDIVQKWIDQGTPVMQWAAKMITAEINAMTERTTVWQGDV